AEQLGLWRFERLREEGRELLAAGQPKRAAETLHTALSLWRGPALTDFENEPFARGETERLEELRITALEERAAADLALGRAARLVYELERHIQSDLLRGHQSEQQKLQL